MYLPFALLFFACFCLLQLEQPVEANSETVASQLVANLLPTNYSKHIRPNYGGPPVNVSISLFIIAVKDISEKTMVRLGIYVVPPLFNEIDSLNCLGCRATNCKCSFAMLGSTVD